jgi:hypothetical protein
VKQKLPVGSVVEAPVVSMTSFGAFVRQGGASNRPEAPRAGQIRSFRIAKLDAAGKRIELELV